MEPVVSQRILDELPEFAHQGLEVMRQPLEDGMVSLGRARGTIAFPAKFMLVGGRNTRGCEPQGVRATSGARLAAR